jgi:hypothetical protein
MQKFYDKWTRNEERFLAYLPEKENDRLRRQTREQTGEPQYTTVEIPMSYAVALTAHTYWSSVFLGRTPVFQFSARHGEPQMRIEAVEALMDYQVNVGGMLPVLYTWLLDPCKYGFGVVGTYWEEEKSVVSRIAEVPELYLGLFDLGKKVKKRIVEEVPGYVGNKLYNVRPQDFFPDPRVPLCKFQQGEFVGRYVEVGWNSILRGAAQGKYFNVDRLKLLRERAWSEREQGSSQITLPQAKQEIPPAALPGVEQPSFVSLLEMYVEIVPSELGLGDTDYPEKWVFVLAEQEVVIYAAPLGLYHNKFPFCVQEAEPDGYSLVARSMMEIVAPLQDTLSWLLNSHFQNVRKAINDMFVFDPSRVVVKDVLDPRAGKYIRLKPEAYGSDPRTAIAQLQTMDITQNHLTDVKVVLDFFQRVSGVSDNVMGMMGSSRRTATESRIATGYSTNRLKTNAEYMSAMAWAPLSQMLVQTTQQMYDTERQFRIAGDLLNDQGAFAEVTPEAIQGFFDFVPVDGTLPVDKFALANLWKELMAGIGQNPMLMQQYDIGRIFAYTARLGGARNIGQFRVNIVPDQALLARARTGNVVPMGGPARSPDAREVMQPAQTPGMGNVA